MLEEYTVPALIICFVTGFLIGLNLGMICSRSNFDDGSMSIPAYALNRQNLPHRYPGHQRDTFYGQQQSFDLSKQKRFPPNGILFK